MQTMSDTRPIWLDIDEANVHGLLDEWDAAPADPAEAIRIACLTSLGGFVSYAHIGQVHAAVLRAIGKPT